MWEKQVLPNNRVRVEEHGPCWENNIYCVGIVIARDLCVSKGLAQTGKLFGQTQNLS